MARMRWLAFLSTVLALAGVLAAGSGCMQLGGNAPAQFTPTQAAVPSAEVDDNAAVPGYFAGVAPWDQGEGVVPVAASAARELYPGDGKFTQAVAAIPFTAPPADSSRSASNLANGADFYFAEHVSPSEVQGQTFDPTAGAAYACYELALPGSGPATIGIAWYSLPTEMASYFIGIGDLAANAWHWYPGPDDGVLTFDPADWGGLPGGRVLVCVALEGGKLADFWQLKAGVDEMRGTGLAFEEPPAGKVLSGVEVGAQSLPPAADLTTLIHPIRNQGSMGSCTAFACTDASLSILLNGVYGDGGWDTADDALKPSPMWAYVKSGIPPIGNWNPVCGSSVGRYMSEAFNVLEDIGAAMDATVPYYATSNCSTTFPAEADTEASLIKISDWYSLGGTSLADAIKAQLAAGHPVVIAMYKLEYTFLNYTSGVYQFNPSGSYVNAGHAMCIVGYDDSLAAFKVRNSWGASWGQAGYWWCGYNSVDQMSPLGRLYAYVMELDYNPAAASHFLGTAPITIDEVEPNDYPGMANALPAFPVDGFAGGLGGNDGADCYVFNHRAGYATDFSAQPTAALDLRLELYDLNGNLIYRPAADSPQKSISGFWTTDGSAVLKVQWLSGEGYYLLDALERQPPPAPAGFTASDGTRSDAVELNWQASPGAESYLIERADSAEGPFEQLSSTFNITYADTTAEHWRYYHYRVTAVNGGGSSQACAPDQGCRKAPAPAGVNASNGYYEAMVRVAWQAVSGTDVVYTVRRSLTAQGPYTVAGQTSGTVFEDTAVDKDVPFFYTVSASRLGFDGPPSAPDSGYRHGLDPNNSATGAIRVTPGAGELPGLEPGPDPGKVSVGGGGPPPVRPK
jgi:C1A family cysteine protease